MNDDFKTAGTNLSPFHKAYLEALRAVMACNDEKANGMVNAARRHFVDAEDDTTVKAIKAELAPNTLTRLYGDHQYGMSRLYPYAQDNLLNAGPWIRDPKLVDMIGRHVAALGDENDKETFKHFVQKCTVMFREPYDLSSGLTLKIA